MIIYRAYEIGVECHACKEIEYFTNKNEVLAQSDAEKAGWTFRLVKRAAVWAHYCPDCHEVPDGGNIVVISKEMFNQKKC